jgi:hypothetical protein
MNYIYRRQRDRRFKLASEFGDVVKFWLRLIDAHDQECCAALRDVGRPIRGKVDGLG